MREHVAAGRGEKALWGVGIDAAGNLGGGQRCPREGIEDCRLARFAMRDEPVDAGLGMFDHCPVAGQKAPRLQRAKTRARPQKICQIAVWWRDQRTGPAHHQIAGQHAVCDLKAHVIAEMPRCPMRGDLPVIPHDPFPVAEHQIGGKLRIHALTTAHKPAFGEALHHGAAPGGGIAIGQHRCAGFSREARGKRGMIQMRMRDKNMAHALARTQGRKDRCEMGRGVGARVNHRKAARAHKIGVGPPKRHGRGVGRKNATDRLSDILGHAYRRAFSLVGLHGSSLWLRARLGLAMSLRWLKPYLPRSLYARAVLILLLPVITLLLVVSLVFAQRLFDDVTQQMVKTVAREVRLVLDEPEGSPVSEMLEIERRRVPASEMPEADDYDWFDLSGSVVIRELRGYFEDLERVSLTDNQFVMLYFHRDGEVVELVFDRRRVSARRPYQVLLNLAFYGILMTVVSYVYMRKQLKPITRLAEAAEAFGRGRHVPYRASGALEVRAAGNAFLDMRARLERQIEQRTLMLSGVSHDLRTPLTRLRLSLAMLEDEEAAPMLRDVRDMERLLEGFLAFARGAHEGEPEPVDPIALVTQIVEDAQRAQNDVTLVEARGVGTVALRAENIRRAVENLINNAVRYGSRAEVSVVMTEKSLRIRVEDDGPGIPPDSRDDAIKPFTRLEPARNQNRGMGVGLGLSIVLDVARAHGGTLRLGESARLGGLCADIVIAR